MHIYVLTTDSRGSLGRKWLPNNVSGEFTQLIKNITEDGREKMLNSTGHSLPTFNVQH